MVTGDNASMATVETTPAEDRQEYRIGSGHADEHDFEAVVVRPMDDGIVDQLDLLKVNLGIELYDLVSVDGGALRIARTDGRDATVDAVKIAYRLHDVRRAILVALHCAPQYGFRNAYCEHFADENEVARELARAQLVLARELAREGMEMQIDSYLFALDPTGRRLHFYRVVPEPGRVRKIHVYSLPFRGLKEGDSLVLWCMDARFRAATTAYLRAVVGLDHYDLCAIPGSVRGIVTEGDASAAMACIRASVAYRDTRHIHLINHQDCGAYGGAAAFCCLEDEVKQHAVDLDRAARFVAGRFPQVQVHTHFQRAEGEGVYFRSLARYRVGTPDTPA